MCHAAEKRNGLEIGCVHKVIHNYSMLVHTGEINTDCGIRFNYTITLSKLRISQTHFYDPAVRLVCLLIESWGVWLST